jgi:hypothetical protein
MSLFATAPGYAMNQVVALFIGARADVRHQVVVRDTSLGFIGSGAQYLGVST